MIHTRLWRERSSKGKISLDSPSLTVGIIATLSVAAIAALIAVVVVGIFGSSKGAYTIGAILLTALIVLLKQNELAAVFMIVISICLDWYLGTYVLAPAIAFILLLIFFLTRSVQYPWIIPGTLWLWGLFLVLTISPAIHGAITIYDTLFYYPDLVLGALIIFWLGTVVARNLTSMRRIFKLLACFSTLIALHIIISEATGNLLFATSNVNAFLASKSYYILFESQDTQRLGSFFLQPDAGGVFLAMMLFIPLGLFVESTNLLGKALYLCEIFLVLIALLFTYSTGAWLAACVGAVVFVILVGSMRHRIQFSLCMLVVAIVMFVGFSSRFGVLLQHAVQPRELALRQGLWLTAWNIIRAYPLTGIGLGRLVYLQRAGAFLAPTQYVAENNPHNSYLEWGAMAGLPVLFVFLTLLLVALWQALRNRARVDGKARALFAAGIAAVIVLSFNSWSFGAWTLPPLAASGWLILGMISSPFIARKYSCKMVEENNS